MSTMADTQPAPIDGELKSPPDETVAAASAADSDENEPKAKRSKKSGTVKTREERLEQNRKAARESRKRKKVLVEELQRSVIFFSRANGTLRSQNEEMEQLLLNAQVQLQAIQGQQQQAMPTPNLASVVSSPWAMMGQMNQGFQAPPPQAQAAQAQQLEKSDAPAPNQEVQHQLPPQQQQQQPPQMDPNMLANWMNLAAMGGMPFMGGMPGMMPFGFPGFGMQGQQQMNNGVGNPMANMGASPAQQQQQAQEPANA